MAYWGRWQVGHDDDAQRDNAFLVRQRLPLPVSSRSLPSSPPMHAFVFRPSASKKKVEPKREAEQLRRPKE